MEQNKPDYEVVFGRLGRDPELKYTKNDNPICLLSLAINNSERKETTWKKVVVWGKQAEMCKNQLKKGSELFVRGRNQIRDFVDVNGEPKAVEEISAHLVGFSNI